MRYFEFRALTELYGKLDAETWHEKDDEMTVCRHYQTPASGIPQPEVLGQPTHITFGQPTHVTFVVVNRAHASLGTIISR